MPTPTNRPTSAASALRPISVSAPFWWVGYLILVVCASRPCSGDVLTVNGPSQNFYSTGPWTVSGGVQSFNIPFARLDSVSFSIYASAEVQQRFTNSGSFNLYPSVNGSATIRLTSGSLTIGSVFLFPSGFGVIPPRSSGNVAGFDTQTMTGALPLSPNPGSFTLSANAGTGPSIQSFGSLQVNYSYTPIGLAQSDPILPTSSSGGTFTFSGVPSGRWFDPVTSTAYRYDMISAGDSFTSVQSFPTGFGNVMRVAAGGNDYGPFSGGGVRSLPSGTRSFTVYNIAPFNVGDPRGFPIQLAFNRSGVTFTATPVEYRVCPSFQGHPASSTICRTSAVQLAVQVSGTEPITFRWQRESEVGSGIWIDVDNGPLFGGNASGAGTMSLTLSGTRRTARYRCAASNGCAEGTRYSDPATISYCSLDISCDGTIDADDLATFITCYFSEASAAGTCTSADFDDSGGVDADDLSTFITTYFATASCQ